MLRNYLTVAGRNLLRHKLSSFINVLGLAIGMACCILITLFIRDEFRHNSFHPKAGRIFRVLRETRMSGSNVSFDAGTSGGITPAMRSDFPEVEDATRVLNWSMWVRYGETNLEQMFCLADTSVLRMFDYSSVSGNPVAALQEPGSVLISETAAQRYFGGEDPIGQVVTVDHDRMEGDFRITGVLKDMSRHAWFRFDFLTATDAHRFPWQGWNPRTSWRPVQNYILLREGHSHKALETKLHDFLARHMGVEIAQTNAYHLQPLTRIRHYSQVDYGMGSDGIGYIRQLLAIAILILLIACVNFMNLATARSTNRAREVGMRKALGACRHQLALQFLGESTLLSFLALILACLLAGLALPTFSAFTHSELSLMDDSTWVGLVGIALFVGLVAGSYPAFLLSAFQPADVLKGTLKAGARSAGFRKALVVFQFSVSVVLIIGTWVVYRTTEYMKHKDLGYNKDLVVVSPIFFSDRTLTKRRETVKQAFLRHPSVLKGTVCWPYPGGWSERHKVRPEGAAENEWEMQVIGIDEDFLDTFEIELAAGRNIDFGIASDPTEAFILNETAVKKLGWEDPIGKQFEWLGRRKGYVIGVVRDFHTQSLHHKVEAVVLFNWIHLTLCLRIRPDDTPSTMAFLEETWEQFIPHQPPDFHFLDEEVEGHYWAEIHQGQSYGVLSLLAIFVACLGLFGLASFTAEQRTKEIGIRKTLGAPVSNLVLLLSREFLKLVAIANLIAWPIAYYMMERWLRDFVYRIDLGVSVFILGGGLALVIALVTVSFQAMRAATANPVDALRYE